MMNALMMRDSAKMQLEQIKDLESGVEYLSKVKAIETWAKAEKKDAELQNMIAEQKLRTQRILGKLIKAGQAAGEMAKKGSFNGNRFVGTDTGTVPTLSDIGISHKQSSIFQQIARIPEEAFDAYIEEKKEAVNNAVAELTTAGMVRLARQLEVQEYIEEIKAQPTTNETGVYDVIVMDPPWPMQKIDREVAPNQTGFDYPTMTEEELSGLEIPAADDCHIWVWTTHKFLPMALRLIEGWGFKYVCTFVWHKPGGFQPFGLPQYNCEFAIYCRKGSPIFIDVKAFNVAFNAPRGAHSEKPEEFYDMVRRVTGGARLDMFNRRSIDGFKTWGNEAR